MVGAGVQSLEQLRSLLEVILRNPAIQVNYLTVSIHT